MKHFKCIVLDKTWRQCMGTFTAPSEEEAKKKLFASGYSIIKLKEIPESEFTPGADFFSQPSYPEEEREKRRSTQAVAAAPEEPRETEPAGQGKSIAVLIALCLVLVAIGIAVFISMHPQKTETALSPSQVVRSYLTLGFRGMWTAQYPFLGAARAERYITAENYSQQMSRNWLDLPAQAAAVSTAEGVKKIEIPPIEVTPVRTYGAHAEVAANVLANNDKRRFLFLLHFDGGSWKIQYIRDNGKADSHVRFLALNPQGPRREAVMNEMQLDFGYTAVEIADLVKQYHLKAVEQELQVSIEEIQEEAPSAAETPAAEKYAEPYVEGQEAQVDVEAQEVESHLASLMSMVDTMEKESKEKL